ncbi:MAG: hypothetical protein S4CHLAM6_13830 [Chlamydiae bacterium]|nr:hypothetical protein [Chlamydiota bacterium]
MHVKNSVNSALALGALSLAATIPSAKADSPLQSCLKSCNKMGPGVNIGKCRNWCYVNLTFQQVSETVTRFSIDAAQRFSKMSLQEKIVYGSSLATAAAVTLVGAPVIVAAIPTLKAAAVVGAALL